MLEYAVAYARYSTSLQQETSIAAQLQAIDAYCRAKNIPLNPHPYIDEAFSGTNMDRTGFKTLLADAQAGRFTAVVVYDITRGSRDVSDWFGFRKQMQQLQIKIYSVTEELGDLDNPDNFLKELLTIGIGQHQVLQSRQKSIAGKRVSAARGLFCGGRAPLGYDIVERQYVINEREAPVVRMAFEMYADGASYSDILNKVWATGITGKLGQQITNNILHFILRNERYTGRFVWFKRKERPMKKYVGPPGADPIVFDGIIPRIISDDL